MRKEYGKVLKEAFLKAMREQLPKFELVSLKDSPYKNDIYIWPGDQIYLWKVSDSIHCYIVLMTSPQYDEFYIFIGWSVLARFPHRDRGMTNTTRDRKEFKEDEFLLKVSLLCGKGGGWSVTPMSILDDSAALPTPDELMDSQIKPLTVEESKIRLLPLVNEAMDCLMHHGVPYIEEFVRQSTSEA